MLPSTTDFKLERKSTHFVSGWALNLTHWFPCFHYKSKSLLPMIQAHSVSSFWHAWQITLHYTTLRVQLQLYFQHWLVCQRCKRSATDAFCATESSVTHHVQSLTSPGGLWTAESQQPVTAWPLSLWLTANHQTTLICNDQITRHSTFVMIKSPNTTHL